MSKKLSRTAERNKTMVCVYQGLSVGKSFEDSVQQEFGCTYDEVSVYVKQILEDINEHLEEYIKVINSRLKGYTFQRLGYVEQAILLVAFAELSQHTADRAVVINEAVELSKRYCDEQAHKLINGVLDRE